MFIPLTLAHLRQRADALQSAGHDRAWCATITRTVRTSTPPAGHVVALQPDEVNWREIREWIADNRPDGFAMAADVAVTVGTVRTDRHLESLMFMFADERDAVTFKMRFGG